MVSPKLNEPFSVVQQKFGSALAGIQQTFGIWTKESSIWYLSLMRSVVGFVVILPKTVSDNNHCIDNYLNIFEEDVLGANTIAIILEAIYLCCFSKLSLWIPNWSLSNIGRICINECWFYCFSLSYILPSSSFAYAMEMVVTVSGPSNPSFQIYSFQFSGFHSILFKLTLI